MLLERTRAEEFSKRLEEVERKLDRLHTSVTEDATMLLSQRAETPAVRERSAALNSLQQN